MLVEGSYTDGVEELSLHPESRPSGILYSHNSPTDSRIIMLVESSYTDGAEGLSLSSGRRSSGPGLKHHSPS